MGSNIQIGPQRPKLEAALVFDRESKAHGPRVLKFVMYLHSFSLKQVSVLFYRLFEHLETTLKSFLDTKELFEKSRLKADKETLVKMTRVILQDLL